MHEVLVNRLGGLILPRKSVVRLTDGPDTTLDVYRGRKTTIQQQQQCRVMVSFITIPSVFKSWKQASMLFITCITQLQICRGLSRKVTQIYFNNVLMDTGATI